MEVLAGTGGQDDAQHMELKELVEGANAGLPNDTLFGTAEARAALALMEENDDVVFGQDGNQNETVYKV